MRKESGPGLSYEIEWAHDMEALRIGLTHATAVQFQIHGWYSNRTVQTIEASSGTTLGSHTVRGTLLEGSRGIGVINLPTLETGIEGKSR
jgi:hypothetical protein